MLFLPTATVITSTKSSVFPCDIEFTSGAAKSLKCWQFVARYKVAVSLKFLRCSAQLVIMSRLLSWLPLELHFVVATLDIGQYLEHLKRNGVLRKGALSTLTD
jgi:hypothetical protein